MVNFMKMNSKLLFFTILFFTMFLSLCTVCATDYDNSTVELGDFEQNFECVDSLDELSVKDSGQDLTDESCLVNSDTLDNDYKELKMTESKSDSGSSEILKASDSSSLNSGSNAIYVNYDDGSDDNSGIDWNHAVKTIEKSLQCVDDDGVIYIAEGTTYLSDSTSNDGIKIDKKVSIIGQGINSVISGNKNKRIFSIGSNAEVFISNLTLTDGYSSNGGAILIESNDETSYGKLKISNSIISNCYATSRGGAIYSDKGSVSDLNNVTFMNDKSASNGGAISIQQKGSLSNINGCRFINNSANSRGGSIYVGTNGVCNIGTNNLFDSNKAFDRYGYGGAIHSANGIVLGTGNVFVNNFAEKAGNALSINARNSEITGSFCFFMNNTAIDNPSLIYSNTASGVSISLENCYWGDNSPIFSNFVNQGAFGHDNYLTMSISANDSVVSGNKVPIMVDFSKNQNNQTTEVNNLLNHVPVLFTASEGNFDISSTNLKNGVAKTNYIGGSVGKSEITVDICGVVSKFSIDILPKQGTVFVDYTNGRDSNDGTSWSSAVKTISHALDLVGNDNPIYVASGVNYLDNADVNGLIISKNISIIGVGDNVILDAKNNGRILYIDGFALNVSNLIFTNADASETDDKCGGAIWANNSFLNIDNCKFINNAANSYGGAINLKYSIADIKQSSFDSNNAGNAGGAINAENTNVLLDISHSVFANNKILNNGEATGAAICSYNTVNILNSIFYNNTLTDKTKKGKSVNQYGDGSLTIRNSALLDGDSSVHVKNIPTALLEDNWWGNNNLNKGLSPTQSYTNANVNSYRIFETSINQEIVHVGDSVTVTSSLNHNQNGDVVDDLDDLPILFDVKLGTTVPNVTTISNELSSIYNPTISGNEIITVDVLGINNTISFFVKDAMPKIVIDDVSTPWSLGVYSGVINYFDIKLVNDGNALDEITIELLSNESDEIVGSYVGPVDKGTSTTTIIDYTIREITEKSIWPGAQDNLIKFTINVKHDGEIISSFSADKILAYNGYFNKTYVYGGHDYVINRNYTINGDIIVSTQDVSVYRDQFTLFRNETWNIETPKDAEIVKVLLYFNYNWDTSFFPDGWTLEFNNHNILDEYISHEMDRGNLGTWGAYNYGLLVFDVTDYYNVNANNSFVINKTKYCALYPSTLYVLYNSTNSDTIKDIYFSDVCDVFYPLYNQRGYDDLLKFVVNFNDIDLTNLHEANWYIFTGSSSLNNKLSFNNVTISDPFVNYSPNDCRPFVYNVTDIIDQNNEAWFISTVNSSTTVAYEQVLVVERGIATTIDLDFNNLTLEIGSSITVNPTVTPAEASITYHCNDTTIATIDENGLITAIKSGKALITVIAGDGVKHTINSTNFTLTVNKKQPSISSSVSFNKDSLNYDINVGLPSDASGVVSVVVDGKSFEGIISNGKAIVSIVGLTSGSKTAKINYSGDYKYNSIEISKQFTVNKINPFISVVAPDVDYGSDAIVTVSVPSDATGEVTVTVDGNDYVGTIDNIEVTFTISGLTAGNKELTVKYGGDDRYKNKSISSSFKVNKVSAALTTDVPTVDYGSDAIVTVNVPYDATGKVIVTVNGKSYENAIKNGNAVISVGKLNAGSHDITIMYNGDSNYVKTTVSDKITVNVIDPSMTVAVSDINVGDSAKFVVSSLPDDATGDVTVTVDGKSNSTIVTKGQNSVEISGLKEGNYQAVITYSGDMNYNSISISKNISVSKNNPQMNVKANNTKYGETSTFKIILPSDATGTVTVNVDGKSDSKTLKNGKATLEINGLAKGDYDYVLNYSGDDKYESDTQSNKISVGKTETSFEVSLINNIHVDDSANFIIYGLPIDATGKIIVTINNIQYDLANVTNGKASISIKMSADGFYTAKVSYFDDENYMANAVDVSFNVNKIDTEMAVGVSDINVGESVKFVVSGLPNDATGNITVSVDGISQSARVSNGKATVSIVGLAFGSKTATVSYSGDYKYNSVEVFKQFDVNKVNPSVSVVVPAVDYGSDAVVTVSVPSDATGEVTVTVDGKDYVGAIEDSKVILTISGLTAGNKKLAVKYDGDGKYNEKSISSSFKVNKVSATLTTDIPAVDYGEDVVVTVSVPSDATGEVTVTVDGKSYNVAVKNAKARVSVGKLSAGAHDVSVVYSGDSNYVKTTVSDTITVNKINPAMTVSVDDIKVDESAVFNVVLPADTNGRITVSINGNKSNSAQVVNGQVDISIKMVADGFYTAKVSYFDDENYMANAVDVSFNVNKIDTEMSVSVSDINVGESVKFVVSGLPNDATGNITVSVDGISQSARVSNGKANVRVAGLAFGSKTAMVSYSGDYKYNSVEVFKQFDVNKVNPSVSVEVPAVDYGEDVVVTVSVPSDATGEVTVTVEGKSYNVAVKNVKARVSVGKLSAGAHDVSVVYSGDSNYVKTTVSDTITVNKIDPAMTVSVDDIKVDEYALFNIVLPADANGKITVSIDNGQSASVNVVNGKVDIRIRMSAEGVYSAKVSYSDDENYIDNSVDVTFNVNKIPTTMHVDVNNISVGEPVIIVVSGLPSDATGEVSITVEDKDYSANVSMGKAITNISGLTSGSKDAVVIYHGDEKYLSSVVNKTFVVSKVTPSMSVSVDKNISVGDVAEFGVVLPSDASGSVTVSVEGKSVSCNVSSGNVSVNISDLTEGFKEAVVSYSGDGKYVNAITSVNILVNTKVEPINPGLNVTIPSEVSVGDTPIVKVSLPIDANGNVTIKLDGEEISDVPVTNGTISMPVSDLSVGKHTVEIIFSGDDNYLSASSISFISVNKKATHIKVVASFTRLATDYYAGERGANYRGYLLDENNKPVVNRIVKITINGVTYKVKTNKNGIFYLRINLNTAKAYPMKIAFDGDDMYLKAPIAKTKLTVIKKSTSIKSSNKVFKAKTKTKKIKVTLKTVKNKYNSKTYLKKGKKITLKVNGKTYTAKTNAKGIAVFSVKLTKKGIYKAVIKFKGDKTYKASTKKIKIRIK